jgi:hypothetical protein
LFGLFVPGSHVYGVTNLAYLTRFSLPQEALMSMAAQGAISPILLHDVEDDELVQVIPLPPKTGIRILDERLKSTGDIDMDSLWMAAVGRQLRRDGLALLRARPNAALETIRGNVAQYFLPADTDSPFVSGPCSNRDLLSPLLKAFYMVVSGKDPGDNCAFLPYLTIPILLCFGLWRSLRWLKTGLPNRPRRGMVAQPSGCGVQNENSCTEFTVSAEVQTRNEGVARVSKRTEGSRDGGGANAELRNSDSEGSNSAQALGSRQHRSGYERRLRRVFSERARVGVANARAATLAI